MAGAPSATMFHFACLTAGGLDTAPPSVQQLRPPEPLHIVSRHISYDAARSLSKSSCHYVTIYYVIMPHLFRRHVMVSSISMSSCRSIGSCTRFVDGFFSI